MVISDNDAGCLESGPDPLVHVQVAAVHPTLPVREDQFRVGRRERGAQVRHQVSRDRDDEVTSRLGGLAVPAPPDGDLVRRPVHVLLAEPEELALAHALRAGAELVGVMARDHVVVAGGSYYSFVEVGRWRR